MRLAEAVEAIGKSIQSYSMQAETQDGTTIQALSLKRMRKICIDDIEIVLLCHITVVSLVWPDI